jgi:hypothetical protein
MQLRAQPCPCLHKRRPRIFSLRIRFAQMFRRARTLCRFDQNRRVSSLRPPARDYGFKEAGLLVKMSSGPWEVGAVRPPYPRHFHGQGFQAFHFVSCGGAVSIRVAQRGAAKVHDARCACETYRIELAGSILGSDAVSGQKAWQAKAWRPPPTPRI